MRCNGIKEIRSAPYHPATNGIAEPFVQTFKQALCAVLTEKKTIFRKLTKFLLACRTIPHVLTIEAPAVLLMQRDLKMRLDILKPNIWERVEEKQQDQELRSSCKRSGFPESSQLTLDPYPTKSVSHPIQYGDSISINPRKL